MKKIFKKVICKPEEKKCISLITACDDTMDEVVKRCPGITQALTAVLYENTDAMCGGQVNFRGISQCHDEDEYDEHRGVDLASTRADMKYHKRMARDYARYIAICEAAIEQYKKLQAQHEEKVDHIERDIERYYMGQ